MTATFARSILGLVKHRSTALALCELFRIDNQPEAVELCEQWLAAKARAGQGG